MPHKSLLRASIQAGLLSGALGGICMGLALDFVLAKGPEEFWRFEQMVSSTWMGKEALEQRGSWIAMGALVHLAVSVFFGGIFGALVQRVNDISAALAAGCVFGVVVWTAMTYLILPSVNLVLFEMVQSFENLWFGVHLIFGIVLSSTVLIRRRFAPRAANQFNELTRLKHSTEV